MTVIGSELKEGKILTYNVILKHTHRFVYPGCDTLTKKRKVWVKNHKCAINF
jgi:hypothetical protein